MTVDFGMVGVAKLETDRVEINLVGWYYLRMPEVMSFDSSILPVDFVCYGLFPCLI